METIAKRWSRARFFSRALCLTEKTLGETVFEDLIPQGLPTPLWLTGVGASLFRLDEQGAVCDMLPCGAGWTPSIGSRDLTAVPMPLLARAPMPLLASEEVRDRHLHHHDGFIRLTNGPGVAIIDYAKNRLRIHVTEDIAVRERTFLELLVSVTEFSDEEFT
jgi:hypothetical protein